MKNSFGRRCRRVWAWLNLSVVLILMGLAWQIGENWWLATLLTYPPQHIFLVPTFLGALISRLKSEVFEWRLNALALLLASVSLLGWQMPLPNFLAPSRSPRTTQTPREIQTPRTLRVMSYNILGGALGIERVAQTIRAQNPDVICLQESASNSSQPDATPRLRKYLPQYFMARGGEVTTFSRFPIVETQKLPFGSYSDRVFLRTILEIDGAKLCVVNAHLWSVQLRGGMPISKIPFRINLDASNKMRGEQFAMLKNFARQPHLPTLIAGDFNTPPRGLFYQDMKREFHDAFEMRGLGFGQTFPAKYPLIRLDYLWSSASWRPASTWTVFSRASDHRPIVAEYTW